MEAVRNAVGCVHTTECDTMLGRTRYMYVFIGVHAHGCVGLFVRHQERAGSEDDRPGHGQRAPQGRGGL